MSDPERLISFMATLSQIASDRFPGRQVRCGVLPTRDGAPATPDGFSWVELHIDGVIAAYPVDMAVLTVPQLWDVDSRLVIERDFASVFEGKAEDVKR